MNKQNHNANSASVRLVKVDLESQNRRLDNFLIGLLRGVPHSHVYNLIRTGQVRVNSGRAKAGRRLALGDVIRVPPVAVQTKQRDIQLSPILQAALQNVVFEDDCMIVLDKPAGIAVHSGTRHKVGLIEAIRQERAKEPGIELAHRLDKDTSGILVLAKNKRRLRELQSQWRRDQDASALQKHYSALLRGKWSVKSPAVVESQPVRDKPLSKFPQTPSPAVSRLSLIRNFRNCAQVNIELHTGKTHQARQHAQQIGQPIAGDKKYGDRNFNQQMHTFGLKRMFLHASRITMVHPSTKKQMTFEAPLPPELVSVIENLESRENATT